MVNVNQIMKQAQAMQKKMADMQEQMAQKEYIGASGGGMVNVTLNGKGEMTKLTIDKSLINPEDVEMIEDLVIAAFNDTKKKLDAESEGAMSGMLGGMGLPPGFKLPF
jgi:DNA-binding YbaB/EbfC family protein